ncbi:MAG: PTS sugar transporter subunit IIA [Planctomycetes bacterium]|nr:PTS sugar transporter subunit IIA [Planctomycetota bacterium]
MKITEFISRKAVVANLKSVDKKGVIQELVAAMKKAYPGERFATGDVVHAILDREHRLGSTGLGSGVAIPHAYIESLKGIVGAFGRSDHTIDFNAVDGQPVRLFFLIASPTIHKAEYMEALKATSTAIRTQNFCKFLLAAKTVKEIEEVFRDAEELAKV